MVSDETRKLADVLYFALNEHLRTHELTGAVITRALGMVMCSTLITVIESAKAPRADCVATMDELLSDIRERVLAALAISDQEN